jgi:ATP-binding cassette subfamily B protein
MRSLMTLNPLFLKYRWHFFGGLLFIVLTNVFTVYSPALIGEGVNALGDVEAQFLKPLREGQGAEEVFGDGVQVEATASMRALGQGGEVVRSAEEVRGGGGGLAVWQAALYIGAFLVKGLFLFFTRQTLIVMSRRMEFDLKESIYAQYQRLDAAFYKRNDTGDLMNRISEDVSHVRMYLGPAVMYTLNLAVLVVLVIGAMLYIDPVLTAFALLPLPLMSVAIYFISATIHRQSDRVQTQQSRLSTFVQQHIAGIRVLQSYHREADAADRFEQDANEYKGRVLGLVRTEALFGPVIVLLVGLSTILTIYVGGLRVAAGALELGHIFQFVFYVNLLTWPFASVGWVTSLTQKAEASMARINAFLLAGPELVDAGQRTDAPEPGVLEFREVGFIYPDTGIRALEGLNFRVGPGETLAITGRTGSGKSTVAALAMRLFDPTSGEVRYGGVPLADIPLDRFRASTGYVPQDVFLFSDTIAANIAFGVDEAKEEEVHAAAEAAQVARNIEGFPQGYSTLLGERGVNLSGGQKQRISIARALMRKPPLLVLDDCLSAVDTETEEALLEALQEASRSSAVLMISHRVSTLRHADRVVVLDGGRVVEEGRPADLAQAGGPYAAMVRRQALEGSAAK